MSANDKDRIGGDVCKHHAARGEKDLARVCPSKLSKRELEDLYYSLLDNNLELKRAVNGQNEKIRLLTTKVNRMTAQTKSYGSKEQRDCCAGAKAIITDQKASIADLKKANECMSERIKRLNMRLCSAKQFLKKSPSQTINKCYKCFSGACTSVKNQSTSALNNKGSDSNLKNKALSSSDSESPLRKTVETNTIQWEQLIQHLSEKSCDENKCRSTMDELKQKIVYLQEELSKSHRDHSQRMSQLEQQVARLQATARQHSDHAMRRARDATQAEGERDQLEMQLSTEKLKVSELETRLKAANMSKEVAIAIEKHLAHSTKLEESRPSGKRCVCNVCPRHVLAVRASTANTQTEVPRVSGIFNPAFEDKLTTSDDSGYAEQHQDSQKDGMISKLNEEFMSKITYLQEQLNSIKSAVIGPSSGIPSKSTFDSYDAVVKDSQVPVLKNVKDYNCVIVDPNSKVIVELAHVNKDVTDNDEEIIDSDIEGNYSETAKTNDQSIMSGKRSPDMQLKEDRPDFEKGLTLYDVNSDADFRQSAGHRKNSISLPENNKQAVIFNDNVKNLDGYESLQENSPEFEKKVNEGDNSIGAPPTAQNVETITVKSKKVICECPPYDSEAAKNGETPDFPSQSRDVFDNKVRSTNSQDGSSFQRNTKPDTHNSPQIPGPLPINKTDSIISRTGKASTQLDLMKSKDNSDISTVGITEQKKVSEPTDKVNEEEVCNSTKCRKYPRGVDEISIKIAHSENVSVGKNNPEKEKTVKSVANENIAKLNDSNESMIPLNTKENNNVNKFGDVDTTVNKGMDVPDYQQQNDIKYTTVRKSRTVKEEVKRLNENAMESVASCRNKDNNTPDMRFESRPACLKDKRRPSSAGNTYTLPSSADKCSRATSPDNTECEISFMSDLPTEKEGTSEPSSLSPGEHKMTTTYRESYTPCHWSTLSEGEVPNAAQSKRNLSISVGEHPGDENTSINPRFPEAAAEKMEAALQSISRELARCRAMLQAQRPREPSKSSRDAETLTSQLTREESILLRRSKANPSIGGASAPKCVFILHIGTIVLSDEAVINSRGAPLMLTWKFFDQSAAMTRMSPGRVVHFDFSTEYEVKMTQDFVEYMKHAEMPIKICEMDDKEKLFAMCTLPLREALLNANRRADLSLELVTALQTNRKAHDSLDTSDEVGVLDLWCMLRAEPRNLMALQMICGLNTPMSARQPKGKTAEMIDDVQSFDCAISQDLELDLNNVSKQKLESVLENDKNLVIGRKSQTPQDDFYVPEVASDLVPPAHAGQTARHQKLGAPSVTSNLGMSNFEARQMMTNINAPYYVDVMRPGVVLTEVTPKVPPFGESTDFERQHDIVYQSYDKFNEKQREKHRGFTSGTEDASYRDIGSSPNIDNWRTMEPPPAMKEIKQSREYPSLESESLSRKKHRESGGASVKMLKAAKELQSLESETISPKKMRDNSSQSMDAIKKVTIAPNNYESRISKGSISKNEDRVIEITVLWLALNEECDAMTNPNVRRLYVAYSFLGRDGAELETPVSLPKPKYYIEKCFFNFKKTFHLTEFDMPVIEHMAKCRSLNRKSHNSRDCIVFSVVSEPPEDPLGLENCEDIGYAYLYLGDLLAYCAGDTFTQVLPVRAGRGDGVCGVLAVRLDGLAVLRARARH